MQGRKDDAFSLGELVAAIGGDPPGTALGHGRGGLADGHDALRLRCGDG